MKLHLIESDSDYRELLTLPVDQRDALFKEKLLLPFKEKFAIQRISFDERIPFNVMTLMGYMHKMPKDLSEEDLQMINQFDKEFWETIKQAFNRSVESFTSKGISLKQQDYYVTALLGNEASPMMRINENYSGDGGIPGYIFLSLVPNEYTINRIASAMAHECNHNFRYQFVDWEMGSLKEMIVAEGLAENFAEKMFGQENIGPWVTKNDLETLNTIIKPKLKDSLSINNMQEAMPYLYGDEITKMQGGNPVGLPYASGYTCGYHLIKYYLKKTGMSIEEATLKTADEILSQVEEFWN